jgi:hypothetical protein
LVGGCCAHEAVCFSADGKAPYHFAVSNYLIRISNFVAGPPRSNIFKIPSACPCAGGDA